MTIYHTFFEFPELIASAPDDEKLQELIHSPDQSPRVFSGTAVKFVRALIKWPSAPQLCNCRFAFADGTFAEVDKKGSVTWPDETPSWFQTPGEFARGDWLNNHGFSELLTPEFLQAFIAKFPDLDVRRKHASILLDLALDNVTTGQPGTAPRARGNKHRISTKPRVSDLNSYEIFSQVFERLKKAVFADAFPTMDILTDQPTARAPAPLKGAVRTWFKAITGELPPNNKRVAAGEAVLFCAPVRERLAKVEAYGLEAYYRELSQAIADAGDQEVSEFSSQPKE